MISLEEAESFLGNILGFKNWKEILERDKLEFLHMVVPYYAHRLAFQNISMSCISPEERSVPDVKEIIDAGLSGIGGACITQNTFISVLLKSLGFDSYTVSGFVHGPMNTPNNHVTCVVEISPEEKYVIDVGVGLPFAGPVPIHDLPYTKSIAGSRYQYKQAGDKKGVYYRVQLGGALFGGPFSDKNVEFVRYEFTMNPQPVEFFEKPLKTVFTKTDESIFLQHPFMFRYFEEDEDGNLLDQPNIDGNRKWILIRGVSVIIANDTTRNVTHYSNYDEVKDVILKYFPMLPKEDVEKSVQYFNETVPKHGYFRAK